MRSFKHLRAGTVEEALALLTRFRGKARINAGGTDLLGVLKDEILPAYPQALVDIKTVAGLDTIREGNGRLKIGALARLKDIVESPLLRERYGILVEAARTVASPQIRNAATLGGNLCQEVRCWYFRYPNHLGGAITCARKGKGPCLAVKGDNRYHAVVGGKKCFAVCPSDTAVALAALDARLVLTGPQGQRKIAVPDFYRPLGLELQWNEILTEIEIPEPLGEVRQHYFKFTLRRPIDFAIVSLAAIISEADGVCQSARLALGALAPSPFRPKSAEEFLSGRILDEDTAVRASELALEGARPLSRNGHKIVIAKTMIKRALLGSGTTAACPSSSEQPGP
jgi:xanthine dehydrogenase YagS FAD-binding subunit